jgi:hypothetical protein
MLFTAIHAVVAGELTATQADRILGKSATTTARG